MYWSIPLQAALLFLTAIIAAIMTVILWTRREMPGGRPLTFLMLGVTVWAFAAGVEAAAIATPIKILWSKIEYLGASCVAPFFLLFAAEYGQREHQLKPYRQLLWVFPALALALVWTNELHGLVWNSFSSIEINDHPTLVYGHGIAFWGIIVYSYLYNLVGSNLLLQAARRFPKRYHRQIAVILIGALIPWGTSLLYILELTPPGLDVSPIGFMLSGLVIALGVFRFNLLDLAPVARDLLIENMQDGILVLDRQNRIIDINPATLQLVKAAMHAPIGQPVQALPHLWGHLSNCQDDVKTETEITLKQEPPRVLDLRITPLYDQQNRFTGRLISLRDITARKQAEQTLHQYTERLKTLREIDEAILAASSPERIAVAAVNRIRQLLPCQRSLVLEIKDMQTVKILAAETSEEISSPVQYETYRNVVDEPALRARQIQGIKDLSSLTTLTPLQKALAADGIRGYMIVPLTFQQEIVGALHLETLHAYYFTAEHIAIAREMAAVLAVAIRQTRLYALAQQEIAERKHAQAALQAYARELEARNAELDAFAHTVAHDIKNSIASIVGFSNLIRFYADGGLAPEVLQESLICIEQSGLKAAQIVDELLLLASVRKEDVNKIPLNMAAIVAGALQRLNELRQQTPQAEITLPDTWPTARGHAPWVEEIWANYLSNALKYGGRAEEAVPPRVELGYTLLDSKFALLEDSNAPTDLIQNLQSKIKNPQSHIAFWVQDNGPGLTPQEQAQLFAEFSRLNQTRATGHGLGLSIVRRISEKLDGEVGVQSTVGQGSLFYFTLPTS